MCYFLLLSRVNNHLTHNWIFVKKLGLYRCIFQTILFSNVLLRRPSFTTPKFIIFQSSYILNKRWILHYLRNLSTKRDYWNEFQPENALIRHHTKPLVVEEISTLLEKMNRNLSYLILTTSLTLIHLPEILASASCIPAWKAPPGVTQWSLHMDSKLKPVHILNTSWDICLNGPDVRLSLMNFAVLCLKYSWFVSSQIIGLASGQILKPSYPSDKRKKIVNSTFQNTRCSETERNLVYVSFKYLV